MFGLLRDKLAAAVDDVAAWAQSVGSWFTNTAKHITDIWTGLWDSIVNLGESAWGAFTDWLGAKVTEIIGFFKPLADFLNQIWGLMQSVMGGGADVAGSPAMQMAGGGPVYGAGTGTSDSINARLSHGEFVVQNAAVRKYGVGFLAALNAMRLPVQGFSFGGLADALSSLSPGPLKFASGGPVVGGGSSTRPFNLVIGGQTFTGLLAPKDVGDKMVTYARGQAMRNAGTKPSWYRG